MNNNKDKNEYQLGCIEKEKQAAIEAKQKAFIIEGLGKGEGTGISPKGSFNTNTMEVSEYGPAIEGITKENKAKQEYERVVKNDKITIY